MPSAALRASVCLARFPLLQTQKRNHNHLSNGWYARGLKAQYYRPAAQAAGFRILKPIAFASLSALKRAFVLLATLKRVFVLLDTQLVKGYIVFLLIFDIFSNGAFI